jgi:hypothetical protein
MGVLQFVKLLMQCVSLAHAPNTPTHTMHTRSHTVASQDEVDAHLSRGVELALASPASGAGDDGRGRLVMIDTAEGYGSSEEKVSSVARTRMHTQSARRTLDARTHEHARQGGEHVQ